MKKLILLFTLISSIMYGQNLKRLDSKNGYGKYTFGKDTLEFNDLVRTSGKGNNVYYKCLSDTLTFAGAEVKSFRYGFYKGKLSSISIVVEGYDNRRQILESLKTAYGQPSQPNSLINDFNWYGKRVWLIYDENTAKPEAKIAMWSKEIQEQEREDIKKAAQSGASDL